MNTITRDDIIRMAREAEIGDSHGYVIANELTHLERFAALVASAEREAAQRAFWEACRPHGKVGEVVYTTYKHIHAKGAP